MPDSLLWMFFSLANLWVFLLQWDDISSWKNSSELKVILVQGYLLLNARPKDLCCVSAPGSPGVCYMNGEILTVQSGHVCGSHSTVQHYICFLSC